MKFSLVLLLGLILCITFSAAQNTTTTTAYQECEDDGECDSGESCCATFGIDSAKLCYTQAWIDNVNTDLFDALDCYGAYTQVAAGVLGVFVAASML